MVQTEALHCHDYVYVPALHSFARNLVDWDKIRSCIRESVGCVLCASVFPLCSSSPTILQVIFNETFELFLQLNQNVTTD